MNGQSGSPDFLDLRTRAEFLELCGDPDGAHRLVNLSLEIAREIDLVCFAYQLMWRGRIDDAVDMLRYAVATHPDSWNAHHSLAEALEIKGEFSMAIAHFREALHRMDDPHERHHVERRLTELSDFATAC
jgi:tetratricopeptide (TPR) repeat protein